MYQAQEQLHSFLRNFPNRPVAFLLRLIIFPRGRTYYSPADELGKKIVDLITRTGEARERLSQQAYTTLEPTNPLGLLQEALELSGKLAPLELKLKQAKKEGLIEAEYLGHQIDEAESAEIISAKETRELRTYHEKVLYLLSVDDFSPDELGTAGSNNESPVVPASDTAPLSRVRASQSKSKTNKVASKNASKRKSTKRTTTKKSSRKKVASKKPGPSESWSGITNEFLPYAGQESGHDELGVHVARHLFLGLFQMPEGLCDRHRMDIPSISNPFQEIFPIPVDEALGSPRGGGGEVSQRILHEFEKRHQATAACGAELQSLTIHGPRIRISSCAEKLEGLRSESFQRTRLPVIRQEAEGPADRAPAEAGSLACVIRRNLADLDEELLDAIRCQRR